MTTSSKNFHDRGDVLEQSMFDMLEQEPRVANAPPPSNREVFRTAVLAHASNSRSWTKVLANRQILATACGDFDPAVVMAWRPRSTSIARRSTPTEDGWCPLELLQTATHGTKPVGRELVTVLGNSGLVVQLSLPA